MTELLKQVTRQTEYETIILRFNIVCSANWWLIAKLNRYNIEPGSRQKQHKQSATVTESLPSRAYLCDYCVVLKSSSE